MSDAHTVGGFVATLSSWVLVGASFITKAMPLLQLLAILLAIAASVYTIKTKRAELRARERGGA